MASKRPPITASEISQVFDQNCVEELLLIARARTPFNQDVFANGLRHDAECYARDARQPTVNDLYKEFEALHGALTMARSDARWRKAVDLYAGLSPAAMHRLTLMRRTITPPAPEDLSNPVHREQARDIILCLLSPVEHHHTARKVRFTLCGLFPTKRVAKRWAERNFVMNLRATWVQASGDMPEELQRAARGGNAEREGPFVKMVERCLKLVGANHANAVALLNEHNKRSNELARRELP